MLRVTDRIRGDKALLIVFCSSVAFQTVVPDHLEQCCSPLILQRLATRRRGIPACTTCGANMPSRFYIVPIPYDTPITQCSIFICTHSPEKHDTVIPTDGRSYAPTRKTYVSNTPKQGTQSHYRRRAKYSTISPCLFFDDINNKSTLIANRQKKQNLKQSH
jgi:hypothetical protein